MRHVARSHLTSYNGRTAACTLTILTSWPQPRIQSRTRALRRAATNGPTCVPCSRPRSDRQPTTSGVTPTWCHTRTHTHAHTFKYTVFCAREARLSPGPNHSSVTCSSRAWPDLSQPTRRGTAHDMKGAWTAVGAWRGVTSAPRGCSKSPTPPHALARGRCGEGKGEG